ncbi:hypothetical protein NQ317_014011 [Molorchus minor]|uniref:Uncharacterized protein n=1 Tax=Molorchus minor TaxID=1323400 RepID=A0ABQ9IRA3_9CUCU|nr:hypothetical protein NQ317_014011 [Molorchus minor]
MENKSGTIIRDIPSESEDSELSDDDDQKPMSLLEFKTILAQDLCWARKTIERNRGRPVSSTPTHSPTIAPKRKCLEPRPTNDSFTAFHSLSEAISATDIKENEGVTLLENAPGQEQQSDITNILSDLSELVKLGETNVLSVAYVSGVIKAPSLRGRSVLIADYC